MDSTYLITDRFLLRKIESTDLFNLVSLDSDPKVMLYISDGKPTTLAWWRDTALPTIHKYYERYNNELGNWIIEDLISKEFIGWFHLRPDKQYLNNRKELELGYRLKRDHWGKGIATEISLALIVKAFSELDAEIVFAKALKGNTGSIKVMEKVGMQFESFYIENEFPGIDKSAARYSIFRSQWKPST